MVVGGKLASTPPHWTSLKKPAPELTWHLVQSLLQQQRDSTSVRTPAQARSESSLSRTGGSPGCRVFVSTLPKTKSEVHDHQCGVCAPSLQYFPYLLTFLSRRKLGTQLPCVHFLAHNMMAVLWPRPRHLDQDTSVLQRLLVKRTLCLCDSLMLIARSY
jgi:hypothetical protein